MADFGITMNLAATIKENGLVEMGTHMTDSTGNDFSADVKGANFEEATKKLTQKMMEYVQDARMTPEERRIKELEAELAELREKVASESESDKCCGDCEDCCCEDKDDLIDDVATYLEQMWDKIGF